MRSLPHPPTHWTLELQRVKLLYIQRQYKQCAARTEELLKPSREPVSVRSLHPAKIEFCLLNPKWTRRQVHEIHQSYLWFYSAIAYEALGRAAHNFSSKKLAFLHAALDGFTACTAVLPSVVASSGPDWDSSTGDTSPAEMSFCDSDSPDPSLLESPNELLGSLTRIIDDSMAWDIEEDPFISSNESEKQECSPFPESASFKLPCEDSRALLFPSPLQIRKVSGDTEGSSMPAPANDEEHNDHDDHDNDENENEHEHEHTKSLSSTRRNDIQFLRSQITASITSIQAFVDEVAQQQRARKATKSLHRAASYWSFSPVQPDSDSGSASGPGLESKEERIARLRAEGWRTVGLRNERRGWKGAAHYQAYSNAVLDELYLG